MDRDPRMLALDRANAVRMETARAYASIGLLGSRGGATRVARTVMAGESTLRFYRLVCSVPRIGHSTATRMLANARIRDNSRVCDVAIDRRQLLAGQLLAWAETHGGGADV